MATKVRDVDRQYEKNNNGELDNGVYNKLMNDSSCSNQKSQHELNPFASDDDLKGEEVKKAEDPQNGSVKGEREIPHLALNPIFMNLEKEREMTVSLNLMVQQPFILGISAGYNMNR